MTRICLILPLLALGAPSIAATPDWSSAARIDISLSNFKFAPNNIHLKAGQPVVIHLANTAGGGHSFSAPAFFAAATVRAEDRAAIREGVIELHGKESRDIALVPTAGRYKIKCTHTFHKAFGMKGSILVD